MVTTFFKLCLMKNHKIPQNVRGFFKSHLGDDGHFNSTFTEWMKENVGEPLRSLN